MYEKHCTISCSYLALQSCFRFCLPFFASFTHAGFDINAVCVGGTLDVYADGKHIGPHAAGSRIHISGEFVDPMVGGVAVRPSVDRGRCATSINVHVIHVTVVDA